MPVPNKMQDLFTLAASNSPAGSDAIGNTLDDYLRGTQAIVRSTNALSSATLASASTTDLGTADAESVQITGTSTITSFGTTVPGLVRECRFAGALTITASSAIVLPGAANIVTQANDVLTFRSLGSGNWTFVSGTRGGFLPLTGGALSGNLEIAPAAGDAQLLLRKAASGSNNVIRGYTGANQRWAVVPGDNVAESTGNLGSNFAIFRYNDAGTVIDTAFSLNRATGAATVKDIATGNVTTTGTIVASSTVTAAQSFISSTTTAILGTTGAGSVGLRPNGAASSTGQFLVQSTGDVTAAGSVTATTNVISPLVSTYTGTVGTQQIWRNMGWNNGVARWREVIEPDAGYSLYRYDAVGGSALRVFNINIGTGMVSAIDFTATSDIRLKEDVTPLERGLAELKHMPPIAYELHGKRYVGFSAQDVLKFLPEAVGETPDGYMTVSHQQLSALIASAVLQLAERVERLEASK